MELEGLKKDLNKVSVRTQEVLASPQQSASAPVLRSELDITVQKMDHAYMLSSIYLDKWVPSHLLLRVENLNLGLATLFTYCFLPQTEDCGNGHP